MHDHVLNSEVKHLVDLGLVPEEVKVSPVQFLGEENVILTQARLLEELSIGKALTLQIESKRHFVLKSVEVIWSNLVGLDIWYLRFLEDLTCSCIGLIEVEAIQLNDPLGYTSRFVECLIVVACEIWVEDLRDVERGSSLDNRCLVSRKNVFNDDSRILSIDGGRDRVQSIILVHEMIGLCCTSEL